MTMSAHQTRCGEQGVDETDWIRIARNTYEACLVRSGDSRPSAG